MAAREDEGLHAVLREGLVTVCESSVRALSPALHGFRFMLSVSCTFRFMLF
jgi:hypothetical protein